MSNRCKKIRTSADEIEARKLHKCNFSLSVGWYAAVETTGILLQTEASLSQNGYTGGHEKIMVPRGLRIGCIHICEIVQNDLRDGLSICEMWLYIVICEMVVYIYVYILCEMWL